MSRLFKSFVFAVVATTLVSCSPNDKKLCESVNPFIGTDFHGHTFPGATAPFGMVQLGPDTRLTGWDGCSGYHYSDDVIYGFSHTHLSGTGCSDYGDILLMPTTGEPLLTNAVSPTGEKIGYPSSFSHDNEHAEAGYYSVLLDDYNIKAELTATERTGFHRYTFPSDSGNVILDLKHRDAVIASSINVVSDSEIQGCRRSRAWAADQHVYFVAAFSEPFSKYGISLDDVMLENVASADGENIKAFFSFKNLDKPLVVTVGISGVSIEEARKNITHSGDFEAALAETQQKWNEQLSKITVKSMSNDEKVTFYTALYHSMIAPNLFNDADSSYRGRDLEIHKASDFNNYTVFSLWDTFRATHPLLSVIEQQRTLDFIKTFLAQYQQGGALPVWELAANETGCMIGYHSIPVIYDAYMKGITDFDVNLALEAMIHSAQMQHLGLPYYMKYGYIASDNEGESVSKTLEYAYDDWCIAMFAKEIGNENVYLRFIRRAQNYKNIFDAETGFFRAKINNIWFKPFDPREVNFNYTEANGWQYNFFVPQDVNTHIIMMGGDSAYAAKLDELFTENSETTGRNQSDITGLIGQYAHGNEPSHSFAYLYNYVGQPWKTQQRVREIMQTLYFNAPDGLCGNEDCGQMSSWYVLSSIGLYPACPGDGKFLIGSPIVEKAAVNLENGKKFVIKTKNQSPENIYVSQIKLNGKDYPYSYISYNDILSGGEMLFYMSPKPNKDFGKAVESRPVNIIEDNLISPVPTFIADGTTFYNKITVGISTPEDCTVYYSVDDNDPMNKGALYSSPLILKKNTTLKAVAVKDGCRPSQTVETEFKKLPKTRSIKLLSTYENQYSAGGDDALINLIRGGNSFKTGAWQGYTGQDITAVVDLGKKEAIREVSMGFIQDVKSWIFFPVKLLVSVSDNGHDFEPFGEYVNTFPLTTEGAHVKEMIVNGKKIRARYVKVVAKSIITCPEWHDGAGDPAWLFADEITIN